jgi:hypothetical protein
MSSDLLEIYCTCRAETYSLWVTTMQAHSIEIKLVTAEPLRVMAFGDSRVKDIAGIMPNLLHVNGTLIPHNGSFFKELKIGMLRC